MIKIVNRKKYEKILSELEEARIGEKKLEELTLKLSREIEELSGRHDNQIEQYVGLMEERDKIGVEKNGLEKRLNETLKYNQNWQERYETLKQITKKLQTEIKTWEKYAEDKDAAVDLMEDKIDLREALIKELKEETEFKTEHIIKLGEKIARHEQWIKQARQYIDSTHKKNESNTLKFLDEMKNPVLLSDIGGLDQILDILEEFELGINEPGLFNLYGDNPPSGLLLHGPPGTGKTMIAKAIATAFGCYFLEIKSSDIVTKWIGESEQILKDNLNHAIETYQKTGKKVIIFIDEAEQLFLKRGQNSGHNVIERIVTTLATYMDGLSIDNEGLIFVGATNRIEDFDPAVLRAGRFSYKVEVPPPNLEGIKDILYKQIRARHRRRKQFLEKSEKVYQDVSKASKIYMDINYTLLAEKMYRKRVVGADINEILRLTATKKIREIKESPENNIDQYIYTDNILQTIEHYTPGDYKQESRPIGFLAEEK